MRSLSRQAVREYDRRAVARGIPGPVLMENAARGTAELLARLGASGPIAVVCGKGNNGGDGFAIARWLRQWSFRVSVELVVDPSQLAGDAAIAFAPLTSLGISVHRVGDESLARFLRQEWIVDAILGTGTVGEVRPPFDSAIRGVNAARRRVLAVDLPSGLDADSGVPLGSTIRAERTATFVAPKAGFVREESREFTGQVHVVDIGGGPAFEL